MSDMKWLQTALTEAAKTSRWLKTEGPNLKAKADAQMAAKKAAAAGTANNAIPANTPMGQQIAQLKGMLQMLPDTHPEKARLAAQIAQLEAFTVSQGQTIASSAQTAQPSAVLEQKLQVLMQRRAQLDPDSEAAVVLDVHIQSIMGQLEQSKIPLSQNPFIRALQQQLMQLDPYSEEAMQLEQHIQYLQQSSVAQPTFNNPFQQQANSQQNGVNPMQLLMMQWLQGMLSQQQQR